MRRNNLSALSDIEMLRRELGRLEEGFRLEREDVLGEGTREALLRFRERSRTRFQPECARISTELHRIVSLLVEGEEWFEEASDSARELGRRLSAVMARLVGTPNRLVRHAPTIESLASGRTREESRASRDPCCGEEDLSDTDPPVECPICGSVLMTDREFTVLVCPGCGVRETVEPDPTV